MPSEVVAQRVEERTPVVGHEHGFAVDHQFDGAGWLFRARGRGLVGQLNEEPQPQVRWALGLSMEKPAWLRPSL